MTENRTDDAELRTDKIRIYPSLPVRKMIDLWMHGARWTYNQAVDYLNQDWVRTYKAKKRKKKDGNKRGKKAEKEEEEEERPDTAAKLRSLFVNEASFVDRDAELARAILSVPSGIRNEAVNQALQAFKTARKTQGLGFTLKHRKKKDWKHKASINVQAIHTQRVNQRNPRQKKVKAKREEETVTITVESSYGPVLHHLFDEKRTERRTRDIAKHPRHSLEGEHAINRDFKIIRTLGPRYWVCVPREVKHRPLPADIQAAVAIDPGVRTFLTCYSPEGHTYEVGEGDMARRIERYVKRYQTLRKIIACKVIRARRGRPEVRNNKHTRRRMRKASLRIQEKIRDLVKEVHHKAAKWLCENFETILLPTYTVSQMVRKVDAITKRRRRINKTTVKRMLTWSFFRFTQHLEHKLREYPHCRVIRVSEAYTTRTCSECGALKDVGASKVYDCDTCGSVMDRDMNGARNIWLRFLTEWSPQQALA